MPAAVTLHHLIGKQRILRDLKTVNFLIICAPTLECLCVSYRLLSVRDGTACVGLVQRLVLIKLHLRFCLRSL